jgi:hypothetical protein
MLGRAFTVGACLVCCAFMADGVDAADVRNVIEKTTPQKAATQSTADSALDIRLDRRKVVIFAGKESLQNASTAKPGDVLQDLATYTNKSSRVLSGVEATLPVPANTELMLNSVSPSTAHASVDGTNFFAMPLKRKVKQANGVEVEQAVALSEYRYLRWYPGELGPKQSIVFSAQFRVADGTSAADGVNVTLKK